MKNNGRVAPKKEAPVRIELTNRDLQFCEKAWNTLQSFAESQPQEKIVQIESVQKGELAES
jgi:phage-related protein